VSSSLSDSPLPSAAVAGTHALAHDAMSPGVFVDTLEGREVGTRQPGRRQQGASETGGGAETGDAAPGWQTRALRGRSWWCGSR